MGDRSVIYVSAVSKELKSARQHVAATLRALGHHPVWEDIADHDSTDQRFFLQRHIDSSGGLVQLIGRCYGAEPPLSARPGGRVSYTQSEAAYARQCGKPVWYLILDRTFPTDPHEPEPKELRTLQAAYIRRVRNYQPNHHPLRDAAALTARLYELRHEFDPLQRGARIWTAGVVLVIALIIGLSAWFLQRH
jgi:hypothetical protein